MHSALPLASCDTDLTTSNGIKIDFTGTGAQVVLTAYTLVDDTGAQLCLGETQPVWPNAFSTPTASFRLVKRLSSSGGSYGFTSLSGFPPTDKTAATYTFYELLTFEVGKKQGSTIQATTKVTWTCNFSLLNVNQAQGTLACTLVSCGSP